MYPLFTICWMPILTKSHLEVMWVCQSVYSGPLSNPAVFSVGELAGLDRFSVHKSTALLIEISV